MTRFVVSLYVTAQSQGGSDTRCISGSSLFLATSPPPFSLFISLTAHSSKCLSEPHCYPAPSTDRPLHPSHLPETCETPSRPKAQELRSQKRAVLSLRANCREKIPLFILQFDSLADGSGLNNSCRSSCNSSSTLTLLKPLVAPTPELPDLALKASGFSRTSRAFSPLQRPGESRRTATTFCKTSS